MNEERQNNQSHQVTSTDNQHPVSAPELMNEDYLLNLVRARMPFGKYKNVLLVDLPETYIMWFARKGFPKGKLGEMLQTLYEIKLNGLEGLLKPGFCSAKSTQAPGPGSVL